MGMAGSWMIYGAYGYTGELTVRLAVEQGLTPIVSGRSEAKVREVAAKYGVEARPASLEEPRSLEAALAGVNVVLNCAGPFSHTYRAVSDACLASRTHYLDITGEIAVFEGLAARDPEARGVGIMLMPGVGFDVVPSDCLAKHLKGRLPDATHLALGFQGLGRVSRGTAKTMAENAGKSGAVRRDGRIVPVPPAWKTRTIDFGRGPVEAVTIPWGDISTAYHSTGIPNIEVYTAMPDSARRMMKWSRYLGWLMQSRPVQSLLRNRIESRKPGPDDAERARGLSLLWGEVTNAKGEKHSSRLRGPEGYTLTALTSLLVVRRVLEGHAPVGFQTPAKVYGADLILEVPGVMREDVS